MAERLPFTREDPADQMACVHCGEMHDAVEMDRLLWCERCRRVERNRAGWWGWVIGLTFAACVGAYVWFVVHPTDVVIGGWVGTVVAAAWIGSKVGREMVFGILRARAPGAAGAPDGEAADRG